MLEKPSKFILVIFGASGDLAWRKLIPALYHLYCQNLLPEDFKILGIGRMKLSDNDFRKKMTDGLSSFASNYFYNAERVHFFCDRLYYHAMETDVCNDYTGLKVRLESLEKELACESNYLFYFAIPPFMYAQTANNLHAVGLTCQGNGWKRVIVEKPFGRDYASAVELNKTLLNYFAEDQIYRIDHYLGKETVQNILVTRFANSIFEPLWNRNHIEYVEITASESLGVGSRAGYYEQAGALRDMLQNHLLQLLAIVAMEPPVSSEANSVRNEMLKVFQSLRKIEESQLEDVVVRGQYAQSKINSAYRQEEGVSPKSITETFVAMRCMIDNWRWSGVPFYIRTGKCLPTRVTEIVIHFKPNPHKIFSQKNGMDSMANQLIIRIQPDEGILLTFGMKVPGAGFHVDKVNMDFHYSSLNQEHLPEAYERLLYDCMQGDATLYQRGDAVEATWNYVMPIVLAWENNPDIPIYAYPAGSWGPLEADRLINKAGYEWHYPCKNLSETGYCEL